MAKIQIYARLRPTLTPFNGLQTSRDDTKAQNINSDICTDTITINTIDKEEPLAKYSKSPGSKLHFRFNHVFSMQATQEEVFETVTREMIDTFLDGYNGTIFAYGQTSSGKTHTIEGSGRKFIDRGLIPRTLSYIYKEIEKRCSADGPASDVEMTVHISYMEIYQDTGYDLLNPGMRPGALMVEVPKVQVTEGPGGEVRIRDLSLHLAATEEVAQSLLFQGSTCRKVAETSMNQCSSRSHTIFSIVLTAKSPHSGVITRSKLNLVDLAGSERVAKTGADGRILQEAKHINLSLHHLEHVIVTLQQHSGKQAISTTHSSLSSTPLRPGTSISDTNSKESLLNRSYHHTSGRGSDNSGRTSLTSRYSSSSSNHSLRPRSRPSTRRGHVPYRNCMLTMVLKDSLGGNCLTAMIATISAEKSNIHETISTCRFSQRVACISNRARRNEELDDKVVIKKLKQRITELEAEILSLKDQRQLPVTPQLHPSTGTTSLEKVGSFTRPLNDTDKQRCHEILHGFFHGKIENPVTAGIDSAAMFHECLIVLRSIVLHSLGISKATPQQNTDPTVQAMEKICEISGQKNSSQIESESTTLSLQSEKDAKASETATHPLNTVPRDKKSKVFITPSPNSRISSGFGSLHEEDGSINYESSFDHVNRMRPAQNESTLGHDEIEQRDSNLIAIEQRSLEQKRKKHRHHRHHRHSGSHGTPSSDKDNTDDASPANNEKEYIRQVMQQGDQNPPSAPKGAWITSANRHETHQVYATKSREEKSAKPRVVQSYNSSTNQSYQSTPLIPDIVNVSPPVDRNPDTMSSSGGVEVERCDGEDNIIMTSPRKAKAFSPRSEKQRKKLLSKQIDLLRSKEEKQRLASEVNLLNLKVLEEGTKDELSHVGEQLAAQHAQYTQLRNNPAANPEHVCAEKIAEQQLRIKQAKLHQKLMDVQYQLRMSGGEGLTVGIKSSDRASYTISPKHNISVSPPSNLTGSRASPQSSTGGVWKLPTPQIEDEILKHEVRQSKVQKQIEKLRLSQMEKQLELREASTRRKILALKQQLQSGTKPPSTAPADFEKPSSRRATTSKDNSPPVPSSKSAYVMLSTESDNQKLSRFHDSPIQSLHEPHVRHNSLTKPDVKDGKEWTTNANVALPHDQQQNREEVTQSINAHDSTSSSSTMSKDISGDKLKTNTSNRHNAQPESTPDNSHVRCSHKKTFRQKLTLPEEIKETEYMSAVQRQKARVSRIRRCIVAATVIQRAWRDYKDNKK